MGLASNVARRGAVYYVRLAVPLHLRGRFGRRELWRSLRTTDPGEARRWAPVVLSAARRLFLDVERDVTLTDAKIAQLVREFYERELKIDAADLRPTEPTPPWRSEMDLDHLRLFRDELVAHLGQGQFTAVQDFADELLDPEGVALISTERARPLKVDRKAPAYLRLCQGLLRARLEAVRRMIERREGEWGGQPSDPLLRPPQPLGAIPTVTSTPATPPQFTEGETLLDLQEKWAKDKVRPAKTVQQVAIGVRRFTELHGSGPAINITRPMVRQFKEALQKLPARPPHKLAGKPITEVLKWAAANPPEQHLSPGAVNKDLGSISAVLAWSHKNGYFDANLAWTNPCTGLKVDDKGAMGTDRLPYDSADIKAIFSSPIYTLGDRPKAAGGEAAKWLPLIALFSGARLEEIAQLKPGDVKQDGEVWFLDLQTLDSSRRVKTRTSRRNVPIHPQLVGAGLLRYTDERRKKSDEWLFPDLIPDQFGDRGGNWSKWWGRYARDKIGITDKRKVFHSFRHAFKDACRAAGIPEEVHDALTGHAGGGVGRSYGSGVPLARLAKAMESITFLALERIVGS
jgi:integrase